MIAHSMVLARMAEIEEAVGREIVEGRKRGDGMTDARTLGHYTEAGRVCKIRAEALRRMAADAKRREDTPHG